MVIQQAAPALPRETFLTPRRAPRPLPPRQRPFVVVGDVRGEEQVAQVANPADVLELIMLWIQFDEDARAVWYLREDWPEAVTVIGRPVPGSVGETARSTHLFLLEPGEVKCSALVARCGAELALPDIEWLRLGAGMPCERCLAATNPPVAPSPRPHLEG